MLVSITSKKKSPVHELAASVEHVKNTIGFKSRYNWGYWTKKLKGLSYGAVLGLVKEALTKDDPGSWLSWKLKNKK